MDQKLVSRESAYTQGLKHYFTGKACKSGHIAQRYTSGGNCVECLAVSKVGQKAKNAMRERRLFAIRSKDSFSYTLGIRHEWVEALEQFQSITETATDEQADMLRGFLADMYKNTRNPFAVAVAPVRPTRTLTISDIKTVVQFDGARVTNIDQLILTNGVDNLPALITIGGEQYVAEHVMRCLQGFQPMVQPFNPKDYE